MRLAWIPCIALVSCQGAATPGAAVGEPCLRGPDCAAGARCRDGRCVDEASVEPTAGPDGEGEGEGEGQGLACPAAPTAGVGAACRRATECGEDALCLRNLSHLQFPGGFCSQDVPAGRGCCPEGSLDVRIAGLDIRPCMTRCDSDDDCRQQEGYFCFLNFGVCFPPPHDDCVDDEGEGVLHCHEARDGEEDGPFFCGDGYDNDGDGLIDCDDPVCTFFIRCTGLASERGDAFCSDRRDNDGDGKTDCDDPDCQRFSICAEPDDG